jgi:cyclopropane-fatty-acyl-phospholipid synthase
MRKAHHFKNRNSQSGSRRNIQEHYDLGNDFFSLFLDESMMYSSAIFPAPQASLEEASWEKVDRVCRQLQLSEHDHVLEIGTGWGGFAWYAALNYGCRVTTTTISEEQHRFAVQRIADAGLTDKVTLLKQDYRELQGQYDKLVSLEMIEAVGRQYLPGYFAACERLVKPDGAMLLQAITMPEQRFEAYASSVDFIQKYIFPGGFLPSITELQNCIKSKTSFRLLHLQDYGPHYAQTLKLWRERFVARLDEVREQGFSERFINMWQYYLCYCEAAFLQRATGLVQSMWVKPSCPLGHLPLASALPPAARQPACESALRSSN